MKASKPGKVEEEGDCVYDYFTFNMDELVYGEDGVLYMPDKPAGQLDSDEDSQDSNREDHDNHEYPEERSSFDEDEHPYRESEDEDVEEAAERYNRKGGTLTKELRNRIMEKLLKKEVEDNVKPFYVPTKCMHEEDDDEDQMMYWSGFADLISL